MAYIVSSTILQQEIIMTRYIPLNELSLGESASVHELLGSASLKKRLEDLGVTKNTTIKCLMVSPLGDPTAYLIRGSVIALRSDDANSVILCLGGD